MNNLMNASLKALLNEQYKLVSELREENKKLKEYNWELIENHKKDIAILCEENEKLRAYADNLAIEIEELKLHIEAKDKAYMDLLTDYNYLQARIKRMEKGYLKFHDDLKKLDDKLDDVIMNR